jgi:GNAT superfamily N-acetyltransferase
MVAIEPAYQHQGYGRQLLTLAETFARRNACTCIVLNAAPDAVGFYTRAGYIAASWDDPSPPAAAIVQMTKDCEQSGV